MRALTAQVLRRVEHLFLYAHGWKRLAPGRWQRPREQMRDDLCTTAHAVNSQKLRNRKERTAREMARWGARHPEVEFNHDPLDMDMP